MEPAYATIWIGDWNLKKGWREPERLLRQLHEENVTPAIHFYYWAEDLSPGCIENGCRGKDRAAWDRAATQLTDHLTATQEGGKVVIILETEFNKGAIARYEPFDGYLAAMAKRLHDGYPNAHVVLGFGNWNSAAWGTWDRAAAASDATGVQALSAAPRDSADRQRELYTETIASVQRLHDLFGKPIVLVDVAVSSFPEPASLLTQRDALGPFIERGADLAQAGATIILYRSFADTPAMALENHFGVAERHWGLAWPNGTLKPWGTEFVAAVLQASPSAGEAVGRDGVEPAATPPGRLGLRVGIGTKA